jgi:hypothetical protein
MPLEMRRRHTEIAGFRRPCPRFLPGSWAHWPENRRIGAESRIIAADFAPLRRIFAPAGRHRRQLANSAPIPAPTAASLPPVAAASLRAAPRPAPQRKSIPSDNLIFGAENQETKTAQ